MLETICNGISLFWLLSQVNWSKYVPLNEDGFPIKPFGCDFCLMFWACLTASVVSFGLPVLSSWLLVVTLPISIAYILTLKL